MKYRPPGKFRHYLSDLFFEFGIFFQRVALFIELGGARPLWSDIVRLLKAFINPHKK